MTNTPFATTLSRDAGAPLSEQIVRAVATRIDDKHLRSGARMPSIRQFAAAHGVSAFTVVASYDRLVAMGYLESRRGAGFFVRERVPFNGTRAAATVPGAEPAPQALDIGWLLRNLFRQAPHHLSPGAGVLPPDWLDGPAIANALRAISRQNSRSFVGYGTPAGFLPLRQQLQLKLAELDIAAAPEQFVTTVGVTQALDIVAREFCQPGDTVFVDDPAWFLMFGSFAALGLRVVGIARQPDGPDLQQLAELAAVHKPRLFIINSVLHNPTSTSLSAAKAFQVLRLAEQHDFLVVEDDIYCDLHPGGAQAPTRLASLDQLQRVIYLSGFSKSMAANLRVGFIATSRERASRLTDRKMLASLTTSDLTERVVHKVLSEGHYRKHLDRMRSRLDAVRPRALRQVEAAGLKFAVAPSAGMFVWVDAGRDTSVLAARAMAEGLLLAPGSLFSPSQLPSTLMRLNVAALDEPALWRFLERELCAAGPA
jgi:DNA-binding transcriptional MocR family regulator